MSRKFDRAFREAGYGETLLGAVAKKLEGALKGLWASRAEQAGATEVRRLGEFLLLELCEGCGVVLPPEAYALSRRGVERYSHFRVVNQHRNDRKAFDDAKPRIRRNWTVVAPMDRIVADVKHLDVIVRRADGTLAWPKIVAFLDAGTGRTFVHPVLLESGEGVRQEHVIEAFLSMVSDPEWGFPRGLYLDNGAEFGVLTKMDSALQLLNEAGSRTTIFAKPYNASAKPIESLFARLDRYVFALMPGYVGPNRMAKKTQTLGRPPAPYPGSWEQFCETLTQLIAAHNLRPVGGQWRGRSPQQWVEDKARDGWRPTSVDPALLDAAFANYDSRRVDRGVVRVQGKRFTHPLLAALPSRTVVDLARPWRRGSSPLARLGGRWVYLEAETSYPAPWIEGAREASRRQSMQKRHVISLAREAPTIDPVAAKIRWAQRVVRVPPGEPSSSLDLGADLEPLADALRAKSTNTAAPQSNRDLRNEKQMRLTALLERKLRGDE